MSFGQYFADALIDWLRGVAFPAPPANVYFSLHSAAPGMTGANECGDATYARVAIATAVGSFAAASSGGGGRQTNNSLVITWPALTAGFTVHSVGIWTAALPGGNFCKGDELAAPIAFTAGESPSIPIGNFVNTNLTVP